MPEAEANRGDDVLPKAEPSPDADDGGLVTKVVKLTTRGDHECMKQGNEAEDVWYDSRANDA